MLASNERRISQHNSRVSRLTGTPVARGGRFPGTQADAHVRARATQEAALAKASMQLDRQRSVALAQLHRAEQRQAMRLDKERHSAAVALDRQRSAALMTQYRATERAAASAARRERMDRRAIAGAVTGRIGRSLGNTLSGVGSLAVGALGIGGSIAAGSAISTQISEQARASQLANQAGRPEIKGQLLREAQATKGFTGMEALEGMGSFVDVTGDLDAARAALPELAQLSLATGAALNDLGAAAGNAFIPLADKIKDPQERMKALLTTMRAIAGQGSVGAVEVKDLAIEMAGLAAATNKFKGDPANLIKSVGAMAQAARQRGGAGTAAEAVTSVSRFVADMAGRPEAFEKAGIQIGTRDKAGVLTQLDDPQEIMVRMLRKTGGDLGQISNLFGVYAERAVAGFSPLYAQAETANMALPEAQREKRGVAGERAVRGEFKRLLSAELTPEQQAKRAASRLDDADLQMKEAMKSFNSAIGAQLIPVVTRLIPEFTKLLPSLTRAAEIFAKFAESAANDPVGMLFKVIGLKMVADLAAAGIGAGVRSTLIQLLSAIRIPLPGGGAPIPLPGGGAAAGTAAGTAAAGGAPVALVGAGLIAASAGMVATKRDIGADNTSIGGLAKGAAVDFVGQNSPLALAGMGLYQGGKAFSGLFGDKPPPMPSAPAATGAPTLAPEAGASAAQSSATSAAQEANADKLNKAADAITRAAEKLGGANLNRGNTPAPPVP